jgi:hypothetical protein
MKRMAVLTVLALLAATLAFYGPQWIGIGQGNTELDNDENASQDANPSAGDVKRPVTDPQDVKQPAKDIKQSVNDAGKNAKQTAQDAEKSVKGATDPNKVEGAKQPPDDPKQSGTEAEGAKQSTKDAKQPAQDIKDPNKPVLDTKGAQQPVNDLKRPVIDTKQPTAPVIDIKRPAVDTKGVKPPVKPVNTTSGLNNSESEACGKS